MYRFALTTGKVVLALIVSATAAGRCYAHFPWLATDDQGRAILFFAESPLERDYRLPDAVADAKVHAVASDEKPAEVALKKIEEDDFIGRRSDKPAHDDAAMESAVTYGIYHGMLLDYYVKGLTNVDAKLWEKSAKSKTLKLNPTPRLTADGIEVVVQWEGKPLTGAKVTMIDAESSPTDAETNAEGVAKFDAPPEGLVGFLVNRTDDKATGKLDDQEYTSAAQYATVTIMYKKPATDAKAAPAAAASAASPSALPSLPEPISSFGGAVCDGWLYVYGGHTGTEHDHSKHNLSAHFRRVKLEGGQAWEDLPMQIPVQGLPLVAHQGKLYRVGGMNARNEDSAKEDLHSIDEFACYDPAAGKWSDMPPLPEPRSSHDAVVIGDTLYVVGGWTLNGSRNGQWLTTAWSFDLSKPDSQWQPLAAPKFKRRALAVAAWNGKLVALGGMDEDKGVSKNAFALDLANNQWTSLPDVPGDEMGGFGVSAWDLDGGLFVSGAEGVVYRLAADGAKWESAGKLQQARFFHRLLPLDGTTLMAVAGASFSDGHLANIEEFAAPSHN